MNLGVVGNKCGKLKGKSANGDSVTDKREREKKREC